jgi:hypothetical protein
MIFRGASFFLEMTLWSTVSKHGSKYGLPLEIDFYRRLVFLGTSRSEVYIQRTGYNTHL